MVENASEKLLKRVLVERREEINALLTQWAERREIVGKGEYLVTEVEPWSRWSQRTPWAIIKVATLAAVSVTDVFGVRAGNCLAGAGVRNMAQFLDRESAWLFALDGLGDVCMMKVEEALRERKWRMKDGWPR